MTLPKKTYSFRTEYRMFVSLFLSLILILIQGSAIAWTNPLMKKLCGNEDNPLGHILTATDQNWISAIQTPGSIVGAFMLAALSKIFGRKPLLVLLGIPSLIFYLIMAFSKELWMFMVARFIIGIGIGGAFTILPIYVCELADPKVRGRLLGSIGIFLTCGMLITYCTGPYVSFFLYHLGYSVLPVTYSILFLVFGIESPYFYIRSDPEKTEQLLKELRGVEDVSDELDEMKRGLKKRTEGSVMEELKTRGTRRALGIGYGLTILLILTGSVAMTFFTEKIFDAAGGGWPSEIEVISTTVFQLIVCSFTFRLLDKFGRKPLLSISFAGGALSQIILGGYFILKANETDLSSFGWVPMFAMLFGVVFNNIGSAPLSRPVLGELFSLRIKSSAVASCTILGDILQFLMIFYFPKSLDPSGMGYAFLIFACFSMCASIYVMIFMIETKGKTLEEIQDILNGTSKSKQIARSEI